MAKTRTNRARTAAREPEPYDKRTVDLTKFKPDVSLKEWVEMFKPGVFPPWPLFFQPIETLSCTRTVGHGRTNVTLIMPTIVQVDAATPYAGFNRQTTPSRNPIAQAHFEPAAYGITAPATYFMAFTIESSGQSTFNLAGYAGGGTLDGAGSKVVSGQQIVTLIFRNVPPGAQVYGYVEQTSGGQWSWFQTRVSFPPLVIGL
jgi:hypothetical protein